MKLVRAANILYYYDGPQVIEARDTIGGHYIAVMVAADDNNDRYLVAGVDPERLRQFRSGMLDLRTLLTNSDTDEWFIGSAPFGPDQRMALQAQDTPLAHNELLPDAGFVLHDQPSDDLALNEARSRNNLVIEVTCNPPESTQDHRIRVDSFTGLLSHFQSMVSHAYRAALRGPLFFYSTRHRFRRCPSDGCRRACRRGAHFASCSRHLKNPTFLASPNSHVR